MHWDDVLFCSFHCLFDFTFTVFLYLSCLIWHYTYLYVNINNFLCSFNMQTRKSSRTIKNQRSNQVTSTKTANCIFININGQQCVNMRPMSNAYCEKHSQSSPESPFTQQQTAMVCENSLLLTLTLW